MGKKYQKEIQTIIRGYTIQLFYSTIAETLLNSDETLSRPDFGSVFRNGKPISIVPTANSNYAPDDDSAANAF